MLASVKAALQRWNSRVCGGLGIVCTDEGVRVEQAEPGPGHRTALTTLDRGSGGPRTSSCVSVHEVMGSSRRNSLEARVIRRKFSARRRAPIPGAHSRAGAVEYVSNRVSFSPPDAGPKAHAARMPAIRSEQHRRCSGRRVTCSGSVNSRSGGRRSPRVSPNPPTGRRSAAGRAGGRAGTHR